MMRKATRVTFFVVVLTLLTAFIPAGCGRSAVDNELIGQVKKVTKQTPLVCDDWKAVDISLGVLRNGVGSMSTQDVWATVTDDAQYATLRAAAETGELVKITYDYWRVAFCTANLYVTKVEFVK